LRGVLFDLDDTVLTHGALGADAYAAIHRLRDAGLVLVAVTGRPAGWGEVVARQWPIHACVVENGALHFARGADGRVRRCDPVQPAERARRRALLDAVVARARAELPRIDLADDVGARTSDVTWDIGEHATVAEEDVARLVALVRSSGARAFRSSVHVHATFDAADKAQGALAALVLTTGVDPATALRRFAYVGDSANDASCFAAFALTFGVANVHRAIGSLAILPRWVADRSYGAGFVEISERLLALAATSGWTSEIHRSGPSRWTTSGSTKEEMSSAELLAKAEKFLYPNYKPAPIVFTSGRGCELFDTDGKRYLDLAAGVAVCSVGHAHPEHARAIADQAHKLVHVSNYFFNDVNVRLAEALCTKAGLERAFFCNSGAEANEALLKLARRHFHARGETGRSRVIAFHSAFHGRTLGALSMTGTPKYKEGFAAPGGVTHVEYGDLAAVRAEMKADVCAIIVEPLQGEGGVVPPPAGFLEGLRALCDEHGALLLMDEVQTGIGRLGAWFGFQKTFASGVRPDAISLAKGLGGGVPIGAMLTTEALAKSLPPGTHGSTFGGNPLACAAAMSVLSILEEEKLVEGARDKGEKLGALLSNVACELPDVCEGERGAGLLRGLILKQGFVARDVLPKIAARGVLLTAAGDRVLRFSPPLVVSVRELEEGVGVVKSVCAELKK
jgi:acetylornithine/N-succinyldiaminopimelate aminotransferase